MDLILIVGPTFLILVLCAYILYATKPNDKKDLVKCEKFLNLQRTYFVPYFLALFSDWLQGPYIYNLYSYYGFSQQQTAVLYVVGFASSAAFGTATGFFADRYGRKRMVLAFSFCYSFCCLTKLFPCFYVLLFGRVCGGISTSILVTIFECWYIHEHSFTHKFPTEWISYSFSSITFFNGILAIFASIVAQFTVEWTQLGPWTPFLIAIPCLLFAAGYVSFKWQENYGERNFIWSYNKLKQVVNKKIVILGVVQSLYESNVYIFVFLWTPVLEPGDPPLGLTFACFMVAVMIGSCIYYRLCFGKTNKIILRYCFILMMISLLICCVTSSPEIQKRPFVVYVSFLSFLLLEISIGMYYPCIGGLREEIIPNDIRGNLMNWMRVPMNIATCMALIVTHSADIYENTRINQVTFLVCTVLSLFGILLSLVLCSRFPEKTNEKNPENNGIGDMTSQVEISNVT